MPAMGLGVLQILDQEAAISQLGGPGGWNDPDMLEVGNGGMTSDEYRAHFSIWAMLAAPLIAGNDLQAMDADTRAILTNRRVIAVDQDALGRPGRRLRRDGDLDVWVRPLSDGAWAIMLLNRGRTSLPAKVQWNELGLPARGLLRVTNLWGEAKSDALRGGYDATLAPHSAQLLRVAR
jgi:alpha-galactosidase